MFRSTDRLPISAVNLVLVSAFLFGAVITSILGNWTATALLGFIGLSMIPIARYARRPGSRDITRVNALEWQDERDRTLAKSGFAIVGVAALLLVLVQFVVVTAVVDAGSPLFWSSWSSPSSY
jgi:hypothetical protein